MNLRTLALASLLAALPLSDAFATIWTVTGTGDTPVGCTPPSCPTLRDAINAARNRDVIQFSSAIDGGTIVLSTSSNDTSIGSTEFGPSAFFITRSVSLIIDGETGLTRGITIARDTTKAPFRLFDIDVGSGLTLQGLTLKNGLAQGFSSDFGGGALGAGGAIFNQGTVSIDSCTFVGNAAQGGISGNVNGNYSGGAGVGSTPSGVNGGGPNGSTSNTADGGFGGGGFASSPGTNGGFGGGGGSSGTGTGGAGGFGGGGGSGNPAGAGGFGGGGGSASYGGGGAGMGGAIFNDAGTLTIVNSTFTGNSASGAAGGGGASGGAGLGGAIFNESAILNIKSSTLARNSVVAASGATADGGAVYSLDDRNCSAGGNICGATISFDFENSIFSNSGGTHDIVVDSHTQSGLDTFNQLIVMSYDNTQFTIGNPVSSADPLLSPLGHHGGLTPTLVPHQGSAAIDALNCASVTVAVDQRGFARPQPQNPNCDVGAVEYDGDYIFANGFDY